MTPHSRTVGCNSTKSELGPGSVGLAGSHTADNLFRVELHVREHVSPVDEYKVRHISLVAVVMKHTVFMACYGCFPQGWLTHARPR